MVVVARNGSIAECPAQTALKEKLNSQLTIIKMSVNSLNYTLLTLWVTTHLEFSQEEGWRYEPMPSFTQIGEQW